MEITEKIDGSVIPNCCDIRSDVTNFKSHVYLRSTVVGIIVSDACYKIEPDPSAPPKCFEVEVAAGLTAPFDYVGWYPTHLTQNAAYFNIDIVASTIPGNVQLTLSAKATTPIPTGTEVRVTIIGGLAFPYSSEVCH